MADNYLQAVLVGAVPGSQSHLVQAAFTYKDGSSLVLEGDSLATWISMYSFAVMLLARQAKAQEEPAITSESLQEALRKKKETS